MHKLSEAPLWTDATANYPYSEGLEASLKFISTYGDEISMGSKVPNLNILRVPRQLAPSLGEDKRADNFIGAIKCKVPPRSEDQAQAIDHSVELLTGGQDHIIEAPTGWGKTYVGSAVAAAMGRTTLIVVTKQDLMHSWYTTLVNLIGVDPKDIGKAQASVLDYKGKRFVLAMVHSLVIEGKYDDDFWRYFGLVLFDETHRMAADSFSKACQLIPAKFRVGLSATPKRSDGKSPVIEANIGPVLVKGVNIPMKPKILVKETGWKIPPYVQNYAPGKMMGVIKAMGMDEKRNAQIVEFVATAYAKGRTVVVMADIIDHLKKLAVMIGQHIPGEEIDFYIGGKSKEELKIASKKRVVMATYGMCAEGTDCPWWDTLVLASPRANVKQPLGRILRSMEGKTTPVCLDLVDNASIMKGFFNKRQKQYYEVGATIVRMES